MVNKYELSELANLYFQGITIAIQLTVHILKLISVELTWPA